jgi:hypothetical protein
VRITLVAVEAKVPRLELPAPGPERTYNTSVEVTRMTPYGPDGTPGRIPPAAVAVGRAAVVATGGAPGVSVGRARVAVAAGAAGVAEGGMTVSVGRTRGGSVGVGALNRERVQPVRVKMMPRLSKTSRVFFMVPSFP